VRVAADPRNTSTAKAGFVAASGAETTAVPARRQRRKTYTDTTDKIIVIHVGYYRIGYYRTLSQDPEAENNPIKYVGHFPTSRI